MKMENNAQNLEYKPPMKKAEIQPIIEEAIPLPRGFTFISDSQLKNNDSYSIFRICIMRFMETKEDGDYIYGHEQYTQCNPYVDGKPVDPTHIFDNWKLTGYGWMFSKQFREGNCFYLSEKQFEDFKRDRIIPEFGGAWMDGKSPKNSELIRTIKGNEEIIWRKIK